MSSSSESKAPKARQTKTGLVVSVSGDKTILVDVETLVKHRAYGKYIQRRTKVAVHDERKAASLGDTVEIVPCRRLSKSKAWRLRQVVREATLATRARAEKG